MELKEESNGKEFICPRGYFSGEPAVSVRGSMM